MVKRICRFCEKEFTARTTVTRYCGDDCAKKAYKARIRAKRINSCITETAIIKSLPMEEIRLKEYLTVKEVAALLGCSARSVYLYIGTGNISAVNLGQRITRVKRSEIDKLFS